MKKIRAKIGTKSVQLVIVDGRTMRKDKETKPGDYIRFRDNSHRSEWQYGRIDNINEDEIFFIELW